MSEPTGEQDSEWDGYDQAKANLIPYLFHWHNSSNDTGYSVTEQQGESMSEPTEAQTLEFWKNMALGLKDELVERGNRIAELDAQLVLVSRALVSTDNADRYYRGFNDGYDYAAIDAAPEPVPDEVFETLRSGLRELQHNLESSHSYMRKHPEEVEALSNAFEWLDSQRPQEGVIMTQPSENVMKELRHLKEEREAGIEEGYCADINKMPDFFYKPYTQLTARQRGYIFGRELRINEEIVQP